MEKDDIQAEDNAREQEQRQTSASAAREPDVILEVPKLKVEEVKLTVDTVKAKLSLSANIVQFVHIEAGADIQIETVDMQLKGIEAEAHLKVRLERVREILKRTMETIDRNPDMLKSLLKPPGERTGLADTNE